MGLLYFYSSLPKPPGFYSHPSLISISVFDLFLKGFTPLLYYSIFRSIFSHNLQKWLRQENFTAKGAAPCQAAALGQGKVVVAPFALPGGLCRAAPASAAARPVPGEGHGVTATARPPAPAQPARGRHRPGTAAPHPASGVLPRASRASPRSAPGAACRRGLDGGCPAPPTHVAQRLPHRTTSSSSLLGITF